MIPVLTPAEMAAVDAAAPEPVEELIERAGAAVASAALRLLDGGYGRRVTVIAGRGSNGADGRSAAVRLRRRGVRVDVIDAADAPERLSSCDLVVDAAYGTGFRGSYEPPDVAGTPVLAVDIPSGVLGTTGEACGHPLPAVCTVTFAALKPGLLLEPGRALAGQVVLADIGLDVSGARAGVVTIDDVRAWVPARPVATHKWRAAVLTIAGSAGMTGAAHLAGAAAQRAGAGMVRVGSPGAPDDRARPLEAVGLDLPAEGWAPLALEVVERFGAVVVGPGLGRSSAAAAGVRELLAGAPRPAVVDGDGLTALGTDAPDLLAGRASATVLTPHDGELAALTGAPPGPDRLAAARDLAAATGAIVLLKGPTTVVADPSGQVAIVADADARLATAGSGDVLSGIVAALLARGATPFEAAAAGAWLHARAAHHGPGDGLVAGDLPALIPLALAELAREAG
jgi:ADP-dependent NAD(P)H-hydrate dehydratase / NAD(P)H-hydrate epimerase